MFDLFLVLGNISQRRRRNKMRKAKKYLTLLLSGILIMSLFIGCAKTDTTEPEDTSANVAPTDQGNGNETTDDSDSAAVVKDENGLVVNDIAGEITIWARMDNEKAGNTIVAQQEGDPYYEFVKKYFPNLKINFIVNKGYEEIQAAIAAGETPDIFFWEGDYSTTLRLYNNGWVEPLDEYMANDPTFVDNFIPAVMNDMKVDGSTYAFPMTVMPQIIIANLDAFDRANVQHPTNDWTIDEFMDLCVKLTDKSDSKNMRVAIARNIDDMDYIRFPQIFLASYGVKGYKEENGQYLSNFGEDPNAIEALDKFLQIQANNYSYTLSADDRNAMGLDAATVWDIDWQSGAAAMFPGASAWAYAVDTATKQVPFKQAFYGPFTGPNGDKGANLQSIAYSIYSGSKNKEAAWAYLNFMTSEAAQTAAYMPDPENPSETLYPLRMDENTFKFNYGIPPFTTDYKLNDNLQPAYDGLKAASEAPVNIPMDPNKMVETLKKVANGEAQLADALKEYDDFINANDLIDWNAYIR